MAKGVKNPRPEQDQSLKLKTVENIKTDGNRQKTDVKRALPSTSIQACSLKSEDSGTKKPAVQLPRTELASRSTLISHFPRHGLRQNSSKTISRDRICSPAQLYV